MSGELIAAIDLGSRTIRMVIAQQLSGEQMRGEQALQIIGVAQAPSHGITRGVINNIEETVTSISHCLENVERMIGQPIESVWVGISGTHIISQESKGVIAVSRPNGEISEEDVDRVVDAARTVATPINYEILHVLPKSFTVDGQEGVKDPTGMTGIRLEVDAQIIQGLSSHIKNITKCVYRTGLDVDDVVLSILAAGEHVLTKRQKELGTLLVNIGASTTSVIVYEEGDVYYSTILPIGSDHITSDIAIGLRTSIDIAERVKLEYGSCLSEDISEQEQVDMGMIGNERGMVSHKYIAEIIQARVEEIFEKIDKELKTIQRSGLLPGGIVLIGGGCKLSGVVEVAKRKLRLPATLGYPQDMYTAIDKVNDVSFTTAVSLLYWGHTMMRHKNTGGKGWGSYIKPLDNIGKNVKSWFQSLLP